MAQNFPNQAGLLLTAFDLAVGDPPPGIKPGLGWSYGNRGVGVASVGCCANIFA